MSKLTHLANEFMLTKQLKRSSVLNEKILTIAERYFYLHKIATIFEQHFTLHNNLTQKTL